MEGEEDLLALVALAGGAPVVGAVEPIASNVVMDAVDQGADVQLDVDHIGELGELAELLDLGGDACSSNSILWAQILGASWAHARKEGGEACVAPTQW